MLRRPPPGLTRASTVVLLLLVASPAQPQAPREIVVGPGEAVRTITAAVAQARPGDRVRVRPGTYREPTILIDRRIELVGEGMPRIDGGGEERHLIRVIADSVVIRGLHLTNAGVSFVRDHAAIEFLDVRGCVAEDNRLEDNFFGIYLARATGCVVARNVITASGDREVTSGNGIHLWSSSDAVIENNHIAGQRDGIYLEHVQGTTIRGNTSEDNLRYGLHFMFSNDNSYVGNAFRRNGAGVAVMYARRVTIRDNVFEDNWGPAAYGLLLKEIADSRIEGNRFSGNTVALSSEGSQRVHVAGNRFIRNGWAARVMANSQENRFVENDFIENSFDVTTNSRRNFNVFEGNYWSRYAGYDLNGDGFGDVPFRPVRLFSMLVERTPLALVLLRSAFVDLLDIAERVAPVLTPETLVDERPRIREVNS
ncbi:MAG TPA: nitrous oxide reductase family maturation protein NosD [Longimicrobiales bacterium]|nr:nitrous oxide reductase family maturation protein NosD [Longimicrobiales bacterium]